MKYEDEKYYHVYNRGANKQEIFLNNENYAFCIRLLKKYVPRYRVSVIAYCLMPNHYHLLLNQRVGGSISTFVQTVFNSYSQAINKAFGHSGTLFQGRAKGIWIDSNEYALRLCRYIHWNPVAARIALKPEDWRYSDYLEWIGRRKNSLTDLSLRDSFFESPEEYQTLLDGFKDESDFSHFES